ncbi:uncharacterized protein LOC107013535 [Solanum pennellii]|uniref:Uncharacterized protein LOC107013535 n=1 Tax=Solanum pennellii TaxID=28526 RepID=A0ABM1GBX2_SOLPN|nr:uncharacterized protein LOC107013535 [Solanum pennellii]
MAISRLMVYVHQVEEKKLRDREEYRNKKEKTGSECGQQKGGSSRPQFHKSKGHAPQSASAPAPQKPRNHPGDCRNGQIGCLKCGQEGHFMRECPKNKQVGGNPGNRAQSSSASPPGRASPKGATYGTGGGTNRLYALNNCQEQENSPDVVTGIIKVFT